MIKKEKKIKEKEEDMLDEIRNEAKKLEKIQKKIESENRMKKFETLQAVVRFLGCFIFIIDICCKIQYYLTVRFVSLQLKQVYKTFLFVRPIAILCILLYNFVIGSI